MMGTKPARIPRTHLALLGALLVLGACNAPPVAEPGIHFVLESPTGLDALNVDATAAVHSGKKCVRVVETVQGSGGGLALFSASDFYDGTIELELSGRLHPDAAPNMRGFVGIAFRVHGTEKLQYECFYLRPTNGRAAEQLRRNHSTQYVSHPEFPWFRLRDEHPGVYESYADLVPGEWTRVKIVADGSSAALYLHGDEQPALVVPELLGADEAGAIGLWIGLGTEAHFRDLRIQQR